MAVLSFLTQVNDVVDFSPVHLEVDVGDQEWEPSMQV
jgi:hypothetical protein